MQRLVVEELILTVMEHVKSGISLLQRNWENFQKTIMSGGAMRMLSFLHMHRKNYLR